jgi:hypothetical protein
MIYHAFLVACMVYSPSTCWAEEMKPAEEGVHITTPIHCAMGGLGGAAIFLWRGEWWNNKGVVCQQSSGEAIAWAQQRRSSHGQSKAAN